MLKILWLKQYSSRQILAIKLTVNSIQNISIGISVTYSSMFAIGRHSSFDIVQICDVLFLLMYHTSSNNALKTIFPVVKTRKCCTNLCMAYWNGIVIVQFSILPISGDQKYRVGLFYFSDIFQIIFRHLNSIILWWKKLWNMKIMVILVVMGAFRRYPNAWNVTGKVRNRRTKRDLLNHSIDKIHQNTENSLGDLRRRFSDSSARPLFNAGVNNTQGNTTDNTMDNRTTKWEEKQLYGLLKRLINHSSNQETQTWLWKRNF